MDEGIDTGSIISQDEIEIEPNDTALTLSEKLSRLSSNLLLETLPLWIEKKAEAREQDESGATMCQLIERSDGRVIWANDAETIYNQYRAFTSWPGIFTYWQREEENIRIKLNKITFSKENPDKFHHQGEVIKLGDNLGVQTSRGVIVLKEIQMEGKANMPIKVFVTGNPNFIGSILK
jgi:methionyl-tRNA formyltransferase